jgi:hypothetical protein
MKSIKTKWISVLFNPPSWLAFGETSMGLNADGVVDSKYFSCKKIWTALIEFSSLLCFDSFINFKG